MNLIDLDKVRWTEGFYDMHTGEQYASMILNTEEWLEWATANAKVKAIPVEWIEKYIWKADTHEEKRALRKMYTAWEKENERV